MDINIAGTLAVGIKGDDLIVNRNDACKVV